VSFRWLAQSGRTDADYGEPAITAEEAYGAIAKAQQLVDPIERYLTEGQQGSADT
jgi:hypothetical protein